MLWKATGYQIDDGWGINLEDSGRRIQVGLGTSADLEVDGGYLSSGGHIAFLPPGTAPTFQNCLSAVGPAGSQGEPLTAIIPGRHADLNRATGVRLAGTERGSGLLRGPFPRAARRTCREVGLAASEVPESSFSDAEPARLARLVT